RPIDVPALHELRQALRKVDHAFDEANLDGIGKFLIVGFDDQLANGRVDDHDLHGGDALNARLDAGQEFLANNRLEVEGQALPHGRVHIGGKKIEDAADGAGRTGSVDGAKNQVACLGRV